MRNTTPVVSAQSRNARNLREDLIFCRTLKMSHGAGWREACASTTRDRR
jgi:hypothetical protein